MASDSRRKSQVIDTVLQAIWPIIRSTDLAASKNKPSPFVKSIASPVSSLLVRTMTLILSDSYTAGRHSIINDRIDKQRTAWAKASGDPKVLGDYIKRRLEVVAKDRSPKSKLRQVVLELIDEGLLPHLSEGLRRIAADFPESKDYASSPQARICLEINRLETSDRMQLLEKIAFGDSDQDPIAFLSAVVQYELPPEIVRSQQPSLDDVLELPTSTEDFPVTNTLLMLIDGATESGNTESLAAKLEARRQSPGDSADIALALLTLAIVESEQADLDEVGSGIESTLIAVQKSLAENRPTQTGPKNQLPFPELETHLAIRAARAGVDASLIEPILRDAKVYAIRGQRNLMISSVSRCTAMLGIGRAAGAKPGTPLRHFQVVSLPQQFSPDSETLKPLFAIDKQGRLSGTGGYHQTHLMFKYPLAGTFTFSARIRDGSWGESDVCYGGIMYQADGWNKSADVVGMNGRHRVNIPVPSIQKGKDNVEAVRVSPKGVEALCNGETYVEDIATVSFPFVAVSQHCYRTTQLGEIKISGSPTIPREVQMIDPTMRGWRVMVRGRTLPKLLLPIGPKQNRQQILNFRKKMEADLAKGPLNASWSVVDGELHYKKASSKRTYDPQSLAQYLRPLQDGESVAFEFWWEKGKFNFSPSLGRLVLFMGAKGAEPRWLNTSSDLAAAEATPEAATKPSGEEPELFRPNIRPKEKEWNSIEMKRTGNSVTVTLNEQQLAEIPVRGHERPGVYRETQSVRVRSIVLRGDDWPEKVPEDLMARSED